MKKLNCQKFFYSYSYSKNVVKFIFYILFTVDCRLSTWSDCDKDGSQYRTIMREPENDGSSCEGKPLTRDCLPSTGNHTNALSICPDKIFLGLNKIKFVPDKIILSMTKYFFVHDKNFVLSLKIIFALRKLV